MDEMVQDMMSAIFNWWMLSRGQFFQSVYEIYACVYWMCANVGWYDIIMAAFKHA